MLRDFEEVKQMIKDAVDDIQDADFLKETFYNILDTCDIAYRGDSLFDVTDRIESEL